MIISEAEWKTLSPEERVIHYNRNLPQGCTHKANLHDWAPDLREAYSLDPYAHTVHTLEHTVSGFLSGTCECNACVSDAGMERGSPFEHKKRKARENQEVRR